MAITLWYGLRTPGLLSADDPNYDWVASLKIVPPFIVIAASLYGTIAYFIESKLYGKLPLGQLILFVVTSQLFATLFLMAFGVHLYNTHVHTIENMTSVQAMFSPTGIAFLVFSFFVNLSITFFRQTAYMIGDRRLFKIFAGGFYEPKKEHIAFLFMDLKSSVETAERLGAERYSKLLQDCFQDVGVVGKHNASIYQYIGDEVVLSWILRSDEDLLTSCIDAWDAFIAQMKSRQAHYIKQYDHIPLFRAGLHAGQVITAEIGHLKRDIAHHGPTINIAARVQEFGKKSEEDLVLTETAYLRLPEDYQKRCKKIGATALRNVSEPINLYELMPAQTTDSTKH